IEKGRSLREIEEKWGKRRNHIEKGRRRRSLIERGERGDMGHFIMKGEDEREVPKRAPIDALKCHITPFAGDGDMESYLEWEMKVD
ncbi:hypothetical protein CR513_21490, partial [Mucuna pruriens]